MDRVEMLATLAPLVDNETQLQGEEAAATAQPADLHLQLEIHKLKL
jgi:hypothetical protein